MTDKLPDKKRVMAICHTPAGLRRSFYHIRSVDEREQAIADRLKEIHNLWEDAIRNNSKSSYILAKQGHIELIKELRGAK